MVTARTALAEAELAYGLSRIEFRAAGKVAVATRKRFGMTATEYNCYTASETTGRYAAVRAADTAEAEALVAMETAEAAVKTASAEYKLAEAITVARNVADVESEIETVAYRIARFFGRLG
jgi:hypothetical protein